MDPRMQHESTMLNISRALAQPQRLRPLVDKYPEIAYFGERFEKVETALRKAQDDIDAARREQVEGVTGTRSTLERRRDRIIRQIYFSLEMYQQAENPELVAPAGRLTPILLPEGRSVTRFSVGRKISEAHNADERLDPAAREDLRKMRTAAGTGLDLHERRMELAGELELVQDRLNAFNGEDLEKGAKLVAARARFVQLILALRTTVELAEIEEADARQLLAPLESELEVLEARRARVMARGQNEADQDDNPSVEEGTASEPQAVAGDGVPVRLRSDSGDASASAGQPAVDPVNPASPVVNGAYAPSAR